LLAGRDGSDPVVAVPASSGISRSPLVGAFILSSIGYRFAVAHHPPVWVVPKLETIRMIFLTLRVSYRCFGRCQRNVTRSRPFPT
jgi:hypothetical protein